MCRDLCPCDMAMTDKTIIFCSHGWLCIEAFLNVQLKSHCGGSVLHIYIENASNIISNQLISECYINTNPSHHRMHVLHYIIHFIHKRKIQIHTKFLGLV
jgi:hypothetical protein